MRTWPSGWRNNNNNNTNNMKLYTICFGLVLAYLAFGGARSLLLRKDTPKTHPSASLVYKPSTTTTTTGEKRRYSF